MEVAAEGSTVPGVVGVVPKLAAEVFEWVELAESLR